MTSADGTAEARHGLMPAWIRVVRERHPVVYSVLWKVGNRVRMQLSFGELLRELGSAEVPLPTLVTGWFAARFGSGRLTLSEFCIYNLHRLSGLSSDDRRAFVGDRGTAVLIEILSDDYSKILNLDKLTCDHVARTAGVPVPEIYALYAPRPRPGAFRNLTNAHELRDFLSGWQRFPIYCKPACGDVPGIVPIGSGSHNFQIERWAYDHAVIDGDRTVSIEGLAARLTEPTGLGFLLMEALRPHSDIADVAGDSVSGVRLHVLRMRNGPLIFKPVWKITRQGAVVDNFQHGRSGNLLASVDVATGRVERVVGGRGRHQLVNPPHPDTGRELTGFQLPHWEAITQVVLDGSELFPGFLCQGWDVAICEDGPVLIEVNWFGNPDIAQLSYGRGFLEGEALDLLRERNLEPLLKGPYARARRNSNARFGRRKAHWPY
jgi:hypothetical protein